MSGQNVRRNAIDVAPGVSHDDGAHVSSAYEASIVIPTHDRQDSLRRTLDALSSQTVPAHTFEVVVVADGCSDDTAAMVQALDCPFALRLVTQDGAGPSVARNRGAACAAGRVLIFLDDDIEAAPTLVEAHLRHHRTATVSERSKNAQQELVVIGYLPPMLSEQKGFFRVALRRWWEAAFEPMRQPGHRFRYSDLLSGNFSIAANLFTRVRGFNVALRCHEDYELGARLIKRSVRFEFEEEAWGYHHERTGVDRAVQRKRDEGRADVQLARWHPDLVEGLPLAHPPPASARLRRALWHLAFLSPNVGDALAGRLHGVLTVFERTRQRRKWRRTLDLMLEYAYWRGVARTVGSRRVLTRLLSDAGAVGGPCDDEMHDLDLDTTGGLARAEQMLDQVRPASVRLRYGAYPLGRIPAVPGAERLRGTHLRPLLATEFSHSLLEALTTAGVLRLASVAPPSDPLARCPSNHVATAYVD